MRPRLGSGLVGGGDETVPCVYFLLRRSDVVHAIDGSRTSKHLESEMAWEHDQDGVESTYFSSRLVYRPPTEISLWNRGEKPIVRRIAHYRFVVRSRWRV